MLTLISGATRTPRSDLTGHLIVPRAWSAPETLGLLPNRWAMDNGAFSGFDPAAYMRMLEVFYRQPGCLWVTCPDVVGDAAATFALWPFWSKVVRGLRLRAAWVAQDGVHPEITPDFDALFIGGTTEFKEGPVAATLIGFAKARGKWVHMGRVNTQRRYVLAARLGVDSVDGTGFSRFPNEKVPKLASWEQYIHEQPVLSLEPRR